jgi:hypothetical protein
MYFDCATMNSLEVLHSKSTASISPDRVVDGDVERLLLHLWAFPETKPGSIPLFELLRKYYPRQVSFKEDIVNAVIGAVNAFEGCTTTGQLVSTTHFHGVPMSFGLGLPESTPTMTFLSYMAWAEVGNCSIWPLFDDTSTDLFPSWSWASVKAQRQSADPGRLYFHLIDKDLVVHQGDIRVWLVDRNGHRVNLNDYATKSFRYEQFLPRIFLTSWAVNCRLWKHSLSGFSAGWIFLDRPSQPTHADVVAVYLGTWCSLGIESERGSACLIVRTTDGVSYRRIGLYYQSFGIKCELDGVKASLDRFRPDGGWELRELMLV